MGFNVLKIFSNDGILSNPGDEVHARVTDTNRKVFKASTNRGNDKYSRTEYPNGTTVETKTTKRPQ